MSDLINGIVRGVAEVIRGPSANDPDMGLEVKTREGVIEILPYRDGRTDPSRGWRGNTDWAALIIYPPDDAPGGDPELYVFPGGDFDPNASQHSALQHIDYENAHQPGVFWTDLKGDAYDHRHTRLAAYRIT